MDKKRKTRSEIEEKYKWDLSKLYKSDEDWYNDFNRIEALLIELVDYKGKIMESASTLKSFMNKSLSLSMLMDNLFTYSHLRFDEDTTNNNYQVMQGKISKEGSDVSEKLSFVDPEILSNDYELVKKYLEEDSELKIYEIYFEHLFRQKDHILTSEEEKLLSSLSETFRSPIEIYRVLSDSDLKFGNVLIDNEEVEVTSSNFTKLLLNNDQNVRKNVFNVFYKTYDGLKNTFASTIKNEVKVVNSLCKIRKYESPLHMALYGNNIPTEVYDNLIKVVNDNLNVMDEYIKLRKQELNVDELHMYDIYADMVPTSTVKYTYEEAIDIVLNALKPLGEEYINILKQGINDRWIDVYENIGKRSGAYSSGSYNSNPNILLNFHGTLDDVMTIAHELGHSMHSYFSNKNQSFIYSGYSIFVAEVASTVNEILVCKYLLNHTNDKDVKRSILNELMDKFKGTLYRQTMFAEFEKTLFELENNNEVLTEQLLSDTYYNLNKKYYGNNIIHDDFIKYEWMRIPHFYMTFYVYQYATGISAACVLANNILENKEGSLDKYIEFLSSGGIDYPINLLNKAGVDMSSSDSIINAINIFKDTIEQYKNLK